MQDFPHKKRLLEVNMDNKNAKLALDSAMNRASVDAKELEENGVMNRSTFYAKRQDMGRMRLSELMMIDELAPFSEQEILTLFGRRDY